MSANEVMYHPIDIQCSLQGFFIFRVCVGLPAVSSVTTANRAVECLTMVGMYVFILNILNRLWMFRTWCFILGTLAASFVGLRAFVLHSDLDSLFESFAGSSPFAGLKKFMADFKQDAAIPWLPIRDQRDIFRSVNEFAHSADGFSEELAVLFATLNLPKETVGSVYENHSPSEGFIRWCVFPKLGI